MGAQGSFLEVGGEAAGVFFGWLKLENMSGGEVKEEFFLICTRCMISMIIHAWWYWKSEHIYWKSIAI